MLKKVSEKLFSDTVSTIIAVSLVGLIVSSGVMVPVYQAEEGINEEMDESWEERLMERGMLSPTTPHGFALRSWSYLYGETLDFVDGLEISGSTDGSEKENTASIEGHSISLKRFEDDTLKMQENHLQDARNLVWSKVKNEVVMALNDNRTEEWAVASAKEEIKDYYSSIEYNLNSQLSSQVKSIHHLQKKAEESETLHEKHFYRYGNAVYTVYGSKATTDSSADGLSIKERNVTLMNGSIQKVFDVGSIEIPERPYSHGDIKINPVCYSDEEAIEGDGDPGESQMLVKGVDEDRIVIDAVRWSEMFRKIEEEAERMEDNAEEYIEGVYEEYRSGDISVEGIIDEETLVANLNTQINETGYYSYAGAKLALMGINTSLTDVFRVRLEESNKTLSGMLFTDHEPESTGGRFRVNETYNPEGWNESCYLVSSLYRIDEPFTILKILGPDGEELDSTGLDSYNRHTTDTEKLEEELEQLNELYEEMPAGNGEELGYIEVNLSDTFYGIPVWVVYCTLVILAYAFLRGRDPR